MWRGIYTAAAGMVAESVRTDTIANNLANVNTSGYKRDEAINREFEPMLIRRIDDHARNDVTSFKGFSIGNPAPVVGVLGMGDYTAEIATDHAQGAMETTGNPFDLAIMGDGYFGVNTPQGVRYTRDGNFYKATDGRIVTSNGQEVRGRGGRPIRIPANTAVVSIGSKGEVFADNVRVGELEFVSFGPDRRAVIKEGNSLYRAQEGARAVQANGDIAQGMLERSNVSVVSEMVNMINNFRCYEAGSKALTTQDTMLDHSVNEVGRTS